MSETLYDPRPIITRVRLQVIQGPDQGQMHEVPPGCIVVGSQADVPLHGAGISRRHFDVTRLERQILARDAGSSHGTTLNGVPLVGEVTLATGDVIGAGEAQVRVLIEVRAAGGRQDDGLRGALAAEGYEVGKELSRSVHGHVVVEATQVATGRPVVVKTLRSPPAGTRELRHVDREVEITRQLSALKNHHIVEFLAEGRAGPFRFMTLERVDGPDLHAHKGERRLGLAEAGRIMMGVLDGLAAAHEATVTTTIVGDDGDGHRDVSFKGVVHRDLSTRNILLERRPGGALRPKVIDFGLAKPYDAAGNTDMTGVDDQGGTVFFAAPEQMDSDGGYRYAGPTADVYAAAAVLYYLLTGRYARKGHNTAGLDIKTRLKAHLAAVSEPAVPIRLVLPDLATSVASVIDRALSLDPSPSPTGRYADARKLQAALRGAGVTIVGCGCPS